MTATFGGGSANYITNHATSGGVSMTKQEPRSRPDLLLTAGLERLDKFDSVAALLAAFDHDGGNALGMPPRAPLDIGALYAKLGNRDRARDLFSAYVDALLAKGGPSSRWPVVAKIVREQGFADIADRLLT